MIYKLNPLILLINLVSLVLFINILSIQAGEKSTPIQVIDNSVGIIALDFSPDNTKIALAGIYPEIWDIKTGKRLLSFTKHRDTNMGSVVFSPDGKMIASGCDFQEIILWTPETGEVINKLQLEPILLYKFTTLSFTYDNKKIIGGELYGDVYIWDYNMGNKNNFTNVHERVNRICCFPDNKRVIINNSLFSIDSNKPLKEFRGRPYISNDRKQIVELQGFIGGYDDRYQIFVWDIDTGKKLLEYPIFQTKSEQLELSPNDRFIMLGRKMGTSEGTRILNIEDSAEMSTFAPQGKDEGKVDLIKFSRDGKYVATVNGSTVYIWDISDLTSGIPGAQEQK